MLRELLQPPLLIVELRPVFGVVLDHVANDSSINSINENQTSLSRRVLAAIKEDSPGRPGQQASPAKLGRCVTNGEANMCRRRRQRFGVGNHHWDTGENPIEAKSQKQNAAEKKPPVHERRSAVTLRGPQHHHGQAKPDVQQGWDPPTLVVWKLIRTYVIRRVEVFR